MANIVLTGDTSGSITVAAPAVAGTNTLTLPASTGTIITDTAPKTGNILQVVNYNTTTTFSTTARSLTNVTGFNVTLTPASTTSKILVFVDFRYGNNASGSIEASLLRDAVAISLGGSNNLSNVYAAHGSTAQGFGNVTFSYLDSPSTTSAVTYQLQAYAGAGTLFINNRNDGVASAASMGSMTVMEVAG